MISETIVTISNLRVVTKDNIELLRDINFDINRGEIVSIVGASGSGKSLTCKAILNLLDPHVYNTSGEVSYLGNNILKYSKTKMTKLRGNDLCMIMQNPLTAFNPLSKVGDQLVETIRSHKKMKKDKCLELLKKHLAEFRLGDLDTIFNSHPFALSGGMLQRLMIGLALALEPALIIADEITSSIDATTKKAVLQELLRIKQKGIALLFVSHDIKEINYISDRVLYMNAGQIIDDELPKSFEHDYLLSPVSTSLDMASDDAKRWRVS